MNGNIHLIDRNIFLRDAVKILSVSCVLIIAKYLITFFFADRDSQLADLIIQVQNIDIVIFCCSLWMAKSCSLAVSFTIFIIIIFIELLFLQGMIIENSLDILLILSHRTAAFSAGLLMGFALRKD
jgi:hypothetical protein